MIQPSSNAHGIPPVIVVGTHSMHVRRFVQGLCDAGQPVVLVTERTEPLVEHGLLLDQRAVDFSVRSLDTARRIRQCIQEWRPRVVHAHQANSVAWHAARGCHGTSVPLVLTIWGSDVLVTPTEGFLKRKMVQFALKSAHLWTADAAELLHAAQRLTDEEKPSALITMGVEHAPPSLAGVWAAKENRMLSCRLHKPLYRVDAIIKGFSLSGAESAAWRLEVAASGGETGALQQMTAELGISARTEFTGFLSQDELRRSYSRSRLYLSFPRSDGTSVSLLEAMAHGCFPIVSDLPANREWVVDGLNGLVVSRAEDLAAAMTLGIRVSQSEQWQCCMAPANHRLVLDKALFSENIRQFLCQYERLGR